MESCLLAYLEMEGQQAPTLQIHALALGLDSQSHATSSSYSLSILPRQDWRDVRGVTTFWFQFGMISDGTEPSENMGITKIWG